MGDGTETDVLEHAIILHEKEDDFGQPTGNAGDRIGCGLIEVASIFAPRCWALLSAFNTSA